MTQETYLKDNSEPRPEVVSLVLKYADALSNIAALTLAQTNSKNKFLNEAFKWKNVLAVLSEISHVARKLPWAELTDVELMMLGFKLWKEDQSLRLIPAHLLSALPQGLVLTSIGGEIFVVGDTTLDTATRLGCLPYGIIGKDRR